jgi:hypothetical protein
MRRPTESRFVRPGRSMVRRAATDVVRISGRAAFGSACSSRSSDSVALNPAVRPLGPEAAITTVPVRLPAAVALRPALTCTFRGFAFSVARIIDARDLGRWAF